MEQVDEQWYHAACLTIAETGQKWGDRVEFSLAMTKVYELWHDRERLRNAIKKHRAQKADDRCWMDDQELYAILGDGNLGDNRVGDLSETLANCKRFIERRCQKGGTWKSYVELETENAALKTAVKIIADAVRAGELQ